MAVAFDTGSRGAATATAPATQSFQHRPLNPIKAVVVGITTFATITDPVYTVTYGGVNLTELTAALDPTTEPARTSIFYLSQSTFASGPQNIVITPTVGTAVYLGWAASVTANADVHITGAIAQGENAALTEVSVSDAGAATPSLRFASVFYGGATPAPAGANSTLIYSFDRGNDGATFVRETTAGTGSRPVGVVQATSDDRAAVYFALREMVAAVVARPYFIQWIGDEDYV